MKGSPSIPLSFSLSLSPSLSVSLYLSPTHTHTNSSSSFNGITGNSVLPQCFNVLLGTLIHRGLRLQEDLRDR